MNDLLIGNLGILLLASGSIMVGLLGFNESYMSKRTKWFYDMVGIKNKSMNPIINKIFGIFFIAFGIWIIISLLSK